MRQRSARPGELRRHAPVMPRQDRDVLRALPQRRDTEVNDVESEQQVRPESLRGRLGAHIAIGGGHEPYIDLAREGFADAAYFLLLYDPQQLGLSPRREIRHFVEEIGRAHV